MLENINVINRDGEIVVSSKEVAKNFEKEHSKVLRSIENLQEKQPSQKWLRYFILNEYKDLKGERRKEYLITKDGFSLLIMGFTGKKALKWKIKYIEAFNMMEEKIKKSNYKLPQNPMEILELTFKVQKEHDNRLKALDDKVEKLENDVLLSSSKYSCIAKAVNERVNYIKETYSLTEATKLCTRELYKAINRDIKRLTGVYTRSQIKDKDFVKVMEFIKIWTPDNVVNYKLKEMLNNQQ